MSSNSYASPEPTAIATPSSLLWRLRAMMFLQYFVQGCYLPIASVYLQDSLGFTGSQVGWFGSALALGPLLAPFLVGQLVDRHYSTERVLAVCHFLGGLFMIALFTQTTFWPVIVLGSIYSVLYVPTMMLTNSLAFHQFADREREFPGVRLWGTIGFVVPAYLIEFVWLRGLSGEALDSARGIAFALSGAGGLLMGLYCLTLPHTPPQRREDRKYAPGVVVEMLKLRHVLILVVVTFVIAIAHKFFFVWNSPFLRAVLDSGGITGAYEQSISSIGQICEVGVMAILGLALKRYGFKRVLLVGALAYTLRCLMFASVFSLDPPFAAKLVISGLGQALHGFCFGCFLAAAYIYVDRVSAPDVRGSMQTLYGTLVIGGGFFAGGVIAGEIGQWFSSGQGETVTRDWTAIWLTCAAIAGVCAAAFAALFPRRDPDEYQADDAAAGAS